MPTKEEKAHPITIAKGSKPLDERATAYEEDLVRTRPGTQHGQEGHTGFRCSQCAAESLNPILMYSYESRDERRQNALLDWQEQCDALQNDFDIAVADHFPKHDGHNPNCDCPRPLMMPARPVLEFEKQPSPDPSDP